MIKFPSIEQFRSTCKHVNDRAKYNNESSPTLEFRGTVKLHGTNASIVIHADGTHQIQSKNQVVTKGHYGFVDFIEERIMSIKISLNAPVDAMMPITIFGEWCGEGIQKGVALSQLDKMFVVFAISYGEGENVVRQDHTRMDEVINFDGLNGLSIYNVDQFGVFPILIDFNNPKLSQNDMIVTTENVERECPAGKFFGKSGIGEGIVYKCVSYGYESSDFWFKVKGAKHSVSKVKTLVEVDVVKLKSITEFIERVLTENRLCQGVDYLIEMDMNVTQKETGTFLSWIFADIMKEESDVMEASGLNKKDVSRDIGKKARAWYFKHIDAFEGL